MVPSSRIVILAAGKSTRMKSAVPKILHTLHGQSMLRYVVDAARAANGTRPMVVVNPVHHLAVARACGEDIDYIEQKESRGTGHAVMSIPPALLHESRQLIVLYGDHPLLTASTIRRLIMAHGVAHSPVSIMTMTVPTFADDYDEFRSFGRIVRTPDGMLDRIVEYKDADEHVRSTREVNPGYYCFDIPWLFSNLPRLEDHNVAQEYYLTDLVTIARHDGVEVTVVPIDNPWEGLGINTPEAFKLAELLLK